jgi:glycogen debranching enzyme
MDPNLQRFFDYVPPARKALIIPGLALASVTSRDQSAVYASSDTLYRGAIFGRDSLEVVEDILDFRPKLARRILQTIGSLQGLETNALNEEEPGKIIHEYRTTLVGGRPISGAQLDIFHDLSDKWGGSSTELRYYGSIDATPHFLRALGSYCLRFGDAILDDNVTQSDGEVRTMRDVAGKAAEWLVAKLARSHSGLLEYQRTNPHGIENQVWKDSAEFYVHEDKQLANHDMPIASIEVQGLAYDALLAAAKFDPSLATDYKETAHLLRDRTIELLWQPERSYFALGTDYTPDKKLRIINTKTANPAALLDTNFFEGLPKKAKDGYVSAIATTILSPDFLTDAGIRSRALSEAGLVDHRDYHGSFVSWPKETYDIAKGLRRQGMPKLARQLENRLLNIVLKAQEYPEFIYVDEWGRVLSGSPTKKQHGEIIVVTGTNKPERMQAWTISAFMAILARRISEKGRRKAPTTHPELEAKLLATIPRVDRYFNPLSLRMRYPNYKYRLSGKPRA